MKKLNKEQKQKIKDVAKTVGIATGALAGAALIGFGLHKFKTRPIKFSENGADFKDLVIGKEVAFKEAFNLARDKHEEKFSEFIDGRKFLDTDEVMDMMKNLNDKDINEKIKKMETINKDLTTMGKDPGASTIELMYRYGTERVNKTILKETNK